MQLTRNAELSRIVEEIEEYAQDKQLRKFTSTPDIKQLKDGEVCRVHDGDNKYLYLRDGKDLYKIQLTKVG